MCLAARIGGDAGALIGGIIGIGVDAVSGAALDLYPNPAHVVMQPLAPGETSGPAEMYLHPGQTNVTEEPEEELEEDDYEATS